MKYYTTYEETERSLANEKDTRSIEEWKEYFNTYVDQEDFEDFEAWLEMNIRVGNFIEEVKEI